MAKPAIEEVPEPLRDLLTEEDVLGRVTGGTVSVTLGGLGNRWTISELQAAIVNLIRVWAGRVCIVIMVEDRGGFLFPLGLQFALVSNW